MTAHELHRCSEEYHVLATRCRERGHQQSADFFDEVAHRCDEPLAIHELTQAWEQRQ